MIITRPFMGEVWIDLNSPTKEELDSLILTEHLDPLIARDLLSPTPKQYAKEFENAVYAVIHLPIFRHSRSINLEQEIDFIILPNGVVTTRYDSIDALHHFAKQIEVDAILKKEKGGHLFFGITKEIYRFLFDEVEYMKDWVRDIEKNIFDGREKEMVFSISAASRNLLSFKRIVGPHELIWRSLISLEKLNLGEQFTKDAKILLEEWSRLLAEVKNLSEMIDELRETNNSILSTKQNEVMKFFTILAFIMLPLTLITSIFGMNTRYIPLIGIKHDFWIVLSGMGITSLVMYLYFKYKKWI